ncbi:MAG: anaerobic sulfatase maturase [Gammaproteobacteria bacterium]
MSRAADMAPFQVMAKPIGPRCNIDCTYCYYLDKEKLYPETKKFRMPDKVLERFIGDYISSQTEGGGKEIDFCWQGGEPTILGVEYFRKVMALQERYRPNGVVIRNSIQTNGTLLDREWARFLTDNEFLVGISIDGPKHIHDRYRMDRAGRPTFNAVMRGLDLLQSFGVQYNVLTAVHKHSALKPKQVYSFLRGKGVEYIQFIPIVERATGGSVPSAVPDPGGAVEDSGVTPWSVSPRAYGKFLCDIFDMWVKRDVGRIFVQMFDVHLGLWMGLPSSLCVFSEECGPALALEHNGDLFSCDHFVYPEYRLGNITETPMAEMARSARQTEFGHYKASALPRQCRRCRFRFACNGGCPKHRFAQTGDGEKGLNYLCDAYRRFFRHAGPKLEEMAGFLRAGLPAATVMTGAAR